jgi:HK97 family phage major capsid protein
MSNVEITRDAGDEAGRVKALYRMGRQFNQGDLAERAVSEGWSVEQMQERILESMATKPAALDRADLGLTAQEKRDFSLVRLLRHMANPGDRKLRNEAGYELAVVSGSDKGEGFRVPHEVLWQRDLAVGSTNSGSKLVGTDHLGSEFVEALRARSVFAQAGARMLTGLRGNVQIPRQSGTSNTYWVGESTAVTESNPTFDQITMTPHTVGTFVDISRRLLIQSDPSIEQLVRSDLAQSIAVELDRVGIEGNPDASATADEPRGIIMTSGVGSVAGGTNGAAPDRADLVALWKEVAQDNADMGNLAYLSNTKVAAAFANTLVDSGSGRYVYEGDGRLLGYPFYITNNVPADLAKGSGTNLSAIIFGNFADAMFGFWSGLDVILDTSTLGTQGGLRIIALQDTDFAVRRPQSFSVMLDAIAA